MDILTNADLHCHSVVSDGTLTPEALQDAVRRLNVFRWLAGLAPTADDASSNFNDQAGIWYRNASVWRPAGYRPRGPRLAFDAMARIV